jgi:diketogulonate reductase-like aldo/keto reductase
MARRHGKTIAQLVFRFAQHVGMLPLTGTTDGGHMREDLASSSFVLTQDEVGVIESIAAR